jgi:flagellar protein FlgJ
MSTIATTQASTQALTPDQQTALRRLHQAAQQFEGVFLGMLFKEMRATVPQAGLFGAESSTTQTFTEMLDQQRAQQLAATGSMGIAKLIEQQLKASVLADAAHESKSSVPQELIP